MTRQTRDAAAQADDDTLIRRYNSGDGPEEAFQELFRRYGPLTHAFFRRRIGIEAVAAEQNQELWLSVVAHLDRFRGEGSFRSWLFSMAHNRLMQLRRRLKVHVDETPEEIPQPVLEAVAGTESDRPEERAIRSEHHALLWRCIARLSDIERVVVYGQYFRGTTLREMTDELGLENPSGARASLIAAQRKLRRCMERSGVAGGAA